MRQINAMDKVNEMNHLSEEDMILLAYGEGGDTAARHVESCAECATAYAALRGDLKQVEPVEPPLRDEAYGERVWLAIAGSLPVYQPAPKRWFEVSSGWLRGLSYAAACAVLVAGAFYAGRLWEGAKKQQPTVAVNKTPQAAQQQARQPIVVVVLGDHLDRSERLLVELKHADPDSAELAAPLRDEARSLLAANHICRHNAADVDDPELGTALGHLDQLLDQMANQPGGLNGAAIARLQNEMNTDGLLFEVRVLRSRIPAGQRAVGANEKGGTI
jgi:hypothetical protein